MLNILLVLALFPALIATASAQDYDNGNYPQEVAQDPIRYPGLNQGDTTPGSPSLPQDLELTVAVGVGYQPDYPGSDDYEAIFDPALDLEYKQRAFLVINREAMMSPVDGLGVKLLANQDFSAGVNLTYDPGRSDDNDFIDGLGDVDWTALAGVFAAYHPGPFYVRGQVGYDILNEFDGYKGELGAGITAPINSQLRGMVELNTNFAGDGYNESYFGVSPAQSAASGLAGFDPDGGFYKWSLGGALQYQLTQGAFIEGTAKYEQLIGDAADSPVSKDDGQLKLSGMVGYKF